LRVSSESQSLQSFHPSTHYNIMAPSNSPSRPRHTVVPSENENERGQDDHAGNDCDEDLPFATPILAASSSTSTPTPTPTTTSMADLRFLADLFFEDSDSDIERITPPRIQKQQERKSLLPVPVPAAVSQPEPSSDTEKVGEEEDAVDADVDKQGNVNAQLQLSATSSTREHALHLLTDNDLENGLRDDARSEHEAIVNGDTSKNEKAGVKEEDDAVDVHVDKQGNDNDNEKQFSATSTGGEQLHHLLNDDDLESSLRDSVLMRSEHEAIIAVDTAKRRSVQDSTTEDGTTGSTDTPTVASDNIDINIDIDMDDATSTEDGSIIDVDVDADADLEEGRVISNTRKFSINNPTNGSESTSTAEGKERVPLVTTRSAGNADDSNRSNGDANHRGSDAMNDADSASDDSFSALADTTVPSENINVDADQDGNNTNTYDSFKQPRHPISNTGECCASACLSPSMRPMRIAFMATAVVLVLLGIITGVAVPLLLAGAQEGNATDISQEEGGTSYVYPSNTWESGGMIVNTSDDDDYVVPQPGDGSGMTVALSSDGSRMAVGAPFATSPGDGHVNAGRITVYDKQAPVPLQQVEASLALEKEGGGDALIATWLPVSHFFGTYKDAQLGHVLHLSEDGTMLTVVTLMANSNWNGDNGMCSSEQDSSSSSISSSSGGSTTTSITSCGSVTTFLFQDDQKNQDDVPPNNNLTPIEMMARTTMKAIMDPDPEKEQLPVPVQPVVTPVTDQQQGGYRSRTHIDHYGRNLRFLQGPSLESMTSAQQWESTFTQVPENAVLSNYASDGQGNSDNQESSGTAITEENSGGLNLGGWLSSTVDNTMQALGNFLQESALMDGNLSSFLDAAVTSTLQVVDIAANTLGVPLDAGDLATDLSLSSGMLDVDPGSNNIHSFSILSLTEEAMDNLKLSIEQGLKNLKASSNLPGDFDEIQDFVNGMVDATKVAVGHAMTNITSYDFWDDYQASLTQQVTVLVASLNVANETGAAAGFMMGNNLNTLDFGGDMLTEFVEHYFETFLVQLGIMDGGNTSMSVVSASTAFHAFFNRLTDQATEFSSTMTHQMTDILSFYLMELNQVESHCDVAFNDSMSKSMHNNGTSTSGNSTSSILNMSMSNNGTSTSGNSTSIQYVLSQTQNLIRELLTSLSGSASAPEATYYNDFNNSNTNFNFGDLTTYGGGGNVNVEDYGNGQDYANNGDGDAGTGNISASEWMPQYNGTNNGFGGMNNTILNFNMSGYMEEVLTSLSEQLEATLSTSKNGTSTSSYSYFYEEQGGTFNEYYNYSMDGNFTGSASPFDMESLLGFLGQVMLGEEGLDQGLPFSQPVLDLFSGMDMSMGMFLDQLSESATFVDTWVSIVLQEASTAYAVILFSMLELGSDGNGDNADAGELDFGSGKNGEDQDYEIINAQLLAQLVRNVTSTGSQMMMPVIGFMTLDVALLLSVFDGLSQELLGLNMNIANNNNNMTMVVNGTNSTAQVVDADNHMCTKAIMELYSTTSLLLNDNVTAMMTQMETFNENLMIGVSALFESLGLDFESKEEPSYFEGGGEGGETWPVDKEDEEAPTNEAVSVVSTVIASDPRWSPIGGGSKAFQVLGDLPSPSAGARARAVADAVKVGLVTTARRSTPAEGTPSSINNTTTRVVLATFVENMAMGGSDQEFKNITSDAAIVLQLLDLDVTTGSTTTTTNAANGMVERGVFHVPSTAKRTGFALASHSLTAAFGTALLNNTSTYTYSEDYLLVSTANTSFVHVVQFDPLSNEWNRQFYDAPLLLSPADSLQCGRDGRNGGRPYHFGQILAFSNNGQTLVAAVSAAGAETSTSANTAEEDHASDADCILVFERTLTSGTDADTGAVSWEQKGSTLAGLPSLESLSVSDNGMAFVAILKHNKRRSNATRPLVETVPVSQSQTRSEGDNNTTGIADLIVDNNDDAQVQAIMFAFDDGSDGWNATAKFLATSAAATAVSLSGDGSMVAVGSGSPDDADASLGVTLYAAADGEERKRQWKACFGDGDEDQRLSCEDCKALVQREINGGDLLKTVQIVQWDAMVTMNYDTSRVRIFCRNGNVDSLPIMG
jgi:hypothetical protein